MSKTKFKAMDFVENIHTGEIEMVKSSNAYSLELVTVIFDTHAVHPQAYKRVSPKKIKFNLGKTNKSK